MIRTRFAPSPTGYLHIGGARTCLFSWLFARANQGQFVLRIEDTDKARSKQEYLEEILDSLKWLGLEWDELYFQSQRFDIYRSFAEKLLSEGKAYKPQDGTSAIILRMPQKVVKIPDVVHGEIQFDTATIKDQVLMKSDGTPTYNFACVIDDAQMRITHVIRGDDHISNTPKQIVIYEALDFSVPAFAHIPMILSSEGGRMSKRAGATAISEYRNMGFMPQAIVNYLSLLGWSPGENQEIISKEEASKKFALKDVNRTAAVFNLQKLKWINSHYLKQIPDDKILDTILPMFKEKGYVVGDDRNYLISVIKLFKDRVSTLLELVDWASCFFGEDVVLSPEAQAKLREENLSQQFKILKERFSQLDNFDHTAVEGTFRQVIEELKIKSKVLIHPLRAATTGMLVGPGIFEVVALLGKERACHRIEKAIVLMEKV